MKNNLISAIAGWKSAALLALVAMVAAVAFSGVLTNTQTADAQTGTENNTSDDFDASPGQTKVVYFEVNTQIGATGADGTRFRIASDSVGEATFANGSTAIRCTNNVDAPPTSTPGCDTDRDPVQDEDGDNIMNAVVETVVGLAVTIADDSPLGEIFVQQTTRDSGDTTVQQEVIINVKAADPPTAIQRVGGPPASVTMLGTEGRHITVRVVKGNGNTVPGVTLNVITTAGALNTSGTGNCSAAEADATLQNGRAFCQVATVADLDTTSSTDDDQPGARVTLFGTGVPGTATVTFSVPAQSLTLEQDVVIHGPVDSITAAALQSSIQVGGSTYIVVTVSDAAGNPISGEEAAVSTNIFGSKLITAPETPTSVAAQAVDTKENVNKERAAGTVTARLGDIPSCDAHPAIVAVVATENEDAVIAQAVSSGTDAAGKCVIQVRAPQAPPTGDDNASATRGTHTVTVRANELAAKPDPKAITIEINVGGAPASIETDAPARADSLSSTTITVTVLDDEGVRVGAVAYSLDQIEGEGKVTGGVTSIDPKAPSKTADGQAKFTYRAPREGTALFLITVPVGATEITKTIEVAVGAAPEEAPDAPPATWNDALVSGVQNVVWNGDDDADVADGAAEGVTAIWQWNGTGWDGYFPAAADVPGGNTLSTLSNGAAYWVIAD